MSFVNRAMLSDFVRRLDAACARPSRLFFVGETSLVYEGHQRWCATILCTGGVLGFAEGGFDGMVAEAAEAVGAPVEEAHPGAYIPLPFGYVKRARPAGPLYGVGDGAPVGLKHLEVRHFDPYSVAFRFLARGDEPDYQLILAFLEHGWLTFEEMDAHLEALLPRFSFETIQQDPAEFRRRYKGLRQMARAHGYPTGTV